MKHKVCGIAGMKLNLSGCAPHPCKSCVNQWPSQNPLAEGNNNNKNPQLHPIPLPGTGLYYQGEGGQDGEASICDFSCPKKSR